MVCEVQFILNQYLYEKKKVHKLYSIAREQAYFDMVVAATEGKDTADVSQQITDSDLKHLVFEPVLNVRDNVELDFDGRYFFKSAIDSDLGLLAMIGGKDGNDQMDQFFCVDIQSNEVVFAHTAYVLMFW